VTGNGVGRTEQTIKKYVTRTGESYYRSLELNQERAAMQADNLSVPITRLCRVIVRRMIELLYRKPSLGRV